MSFCHCHLHGEFSLLDGCGKSEDYAERAVEIEQSAVALTDHGNLAGVLYHAQACEEEGIKPIIGMEAYFEPVAGHCQETKTRAHHLLLISKNMEGFRNLMRLSSAGYDEKRRYYVPIIDWDLLAQHSSGLIASSTCVSGYIPELILQGKVEDAEEALDRFLQIFGDDFYMEIQPHDFEDQAIINAAIIEMARKRGLPLLATVDTHYPDASWMQAQDTTILLSTGSDLKKREAEEAEGKKTMRAYPTTWMMTEEQVRDHFSAINVPQKVVDEAIANTALIAESVEPFSFDKSPKVPKAAESPEDAERILREWCEEGLERVGRTDDAAYRERMEMELDMFRRKGVLDYFVIIGDIVRWAKSTEPLPSVKAEDPEATKAPIRVGACRGSAGASLVLYLSRVTAIDPIGYDLLFARFMSDARSDMPDVDLDFAHNRRKEVRDYIYEKYGAEHVADVASFQSFGMKSAIKDVSRARNIDFGEAERASRDLDDEAIGTTLEDVVDVPGHERLAEWRDNHEEEWEIALRLEGQVKGTSKHAAAVVVTSEPVNELMPTMRAKDGSTVTQWTARANAEIIATYGFLKIDLLATVGLTVQQECIDLIYKRHGVVVDFEDPETHPEVVTPVGELDVCERFARGSNLGIFQFGSAGICRALSEIKPSTIDHLIAANAMYRPGPIQNIGIYVRRKNGREPWEVPPAAERVLGNTFGLITYQEQGMQLCIDLAGMDPAQADIVRKVLGKGVARDIEGRDKIDKMREEWAAGCAKKGISVSYSKRLWEEMLQMATYSFNRAHAAGYALQAYQDQWLKEHYPIEFYTALLKWDPEKNAQTIREARAAGIEILPPDINDSAPDFTLVENTIRFGLLGVKNVGQVAADHIFELRPFSSLEDFEGRITKQKCNARVRGSLGNCGAFDRWGYRDELSDEEKADLELELMGFAPSRQSDLAVYREFLVEECDIQIPDEKFDGESINLCGEITKVTKRKTKKNQPMAFITLWYDGHEFEAILWAPQLEAFDSLLVPGLAVLLNGEWQGEKGSLIVRDMMSVRDLATRLLDEGR